MMCRVRFLTTVATVSLLALVGAAIPAQATALGHDAVSSDATQRSHAVLSDVRGFAHPGETTSAMQVNFNGHSFVDARVVVQAPSGTSISARTNAGVQFESNPAGTLVQSEVVDLWHSGAQNLFVEVRVDDSVDIGTVLNDGIVEFREEGTSAVLARASLGVTVTGQITITQHPSDAHGPEGGTAEFRTASTGHQVLIQWQVSEDSGTTWTDVPGAADATYATPRISPEMHGRQYRAVHTNRAGQLVTSPASLFVIARPVVTEHPSDITVDEGAEAAFTTSASGEDVRTQWQVSKDRGASWSDVEGATGTTLSFEATTAEMTRSWYRAVHTNGAGPVATNHAVLLVRTTPVFITHPSDLSVLPGASALFFGQADDGASNAILPAILPLSWEISRDGEVWWPYEHGTFPEFVQFSNTLHTSKIAAEMDGLRFRAVAENHLGRAVSEPALLTVLAAPVIDSHPADARILVGYEATFSASTPAVSPNRTQQWQVRAAGGEWADIPGATQPVYSTGPTTLAMDQNEYRIVFTNAYGSTASESATLTVREPLPASVSITPTVRLVDRLP